MRDKERWNTQQVVFVSRMYPLIEALTDLAEAVVPGVDPLSHKSVHPIVYVYAFCADTMIGSARVFLADAVIRDVMLSYLTFVELEIPEKLSLSRNFMTFGKGAKIQTAPNFVQTLQQHAMDYLPDRLERLFIGKELDIGFRAA